MARKVDLLIVDDEEVVLASIAKALTDNDQYTYQLDTALSASEGLAMAAAKRYDLVLTDLMMPGLDGIEFLDRLHDLDENLRVIMITGYATMRVARDVIKKGACNFIAKPFTHEELRQVVSEALTGTA
jgi:DNA-binding NtrC family response regulator